MVQYLMLKFLSISNFAIIDSIELEIGSGLNVFTGETGAGKSIIVDALSLVLGRKTDRSAIKQGSNEAVIQAVFEVTDFQKQKINTLLDTKPGNEIVLSRSVTDRRSVCRVDGMIISLSTLRNIGSIVCEVHGQGQQTYLVNSDHQLSIIDEYGQLQKSRKQFSAKFEKFKALQARIKQSEQQRLQTQERRELLRFQIDEIDSCQIEPNEEAVLKEAIDRLSNASQLKSSATEAIQIFSGDENDNRWSVENLMREAGAFLGQLKSMDPSADQFNDLANEMLFNIEDIVRRLRDYASLIEVNPEELQRLETRLVMLNDIKRKYGQSLKDVLDYRDKGALQLEELDTAGEKIQDLMAIAIEQENELSSAALKLSVKRKQLAKLLENKVETYLHGAGMENAKFEVIITNRKDEDGLPIAFKEATDTYAIGPDGIDEVEMCFSANKNQSPLPLNQAASGGELSRIMLSIFVTVNSSETKSTLVFDEIDSGVGGRTGTMLGQKLKDLSQNRQVICVTHLPQLASFANNHWAISKNESNGKTLVSARLLREREIVNELGLMIASGDKTSDVAAQAMIDQARTQA